LPPGVLAEATARAARPEGELEKPPHRERPIGKQTLVGIAPIPAAPPRKEVTDDLPAPAIPGAAPAPAVAPLAASPRVVKSQADLPPPPPIPAELSAPVPTPAIGDQAMSSVAIESTKPPPSEPPRGIVAPYQPKDDPSGPAVVLKDDVLAMEEAQAATEELLREHAASSRRAPTIMNLKAPSASAYPAPDFAAKKRSKGPLLIGGGVLALAAALIAVVAIGSKAQQSSAPAAPGASLVTPAVTRASEPPAALEVPPPLPPEAPVEPPARESETEPRVAAAAKPTAKKAAPKAPNKASAKPASGTTAPAPKKSGVIVRDTPF
jgi:hypothetical protein